MAEAQEVVVPTARDPLNTAKKVKTEPTARTVLMVGGNARSSGIGAHARLRILLRWLESIVPLMGGDAARGSHVAVAAREKVRLCD